MIPTEIVNQHCSDFPRMLITLTHMPCTVFAAVVMELMIDIQARNM